MSKPSVSPRCPACGVRFRSVMECPRCGADLGPLMSLAARAYLLRLDARRRLQEGEPARAARLAESAQSLMATPSGRGLERIARWLAEQLPAT